MTSWKKEKNNNAQWLLRNRDTFILLLSLSFSLARSLCLSLSRSLDEWSTKKLNWKMLRKVISSKLCLVLPVRMKIQNRWLSYLEKHDSGFSRL